MAQPPRLCARCSFFYLRQASAQGLLSPSLACMFSIRPGVEAQILPWQTSDQTSGQTEAQIHPTSSLTDRPRGNPALECTAAFLLILAFMAWIQFASPAIVGNDAYYHIRWSRMLRESLPHLPAFKWLPLTVLRTQLFVDQHFLFHVSLMPFTFGDLRLGAKLAAPLFSAIAMTSIFGLLVVYRIRYRWLWLLALAASSEPFLYRMSMTRAPSLSLLLLAVGVYLILERRWVSLAVLTFVFVWLYNMFPLIVAFAFLYAVTVWLSKNRIDLAALYATSIGAALGLVINPYFPKDLLLIFHHVHMLLAETVTMDVGSEWYPYDTWEMLTKNAALFALCFAALLAFDFRTLDFRKGARDRRPLFFLLLSAMFLLMTFRWRRFVEYWPPFAILFAAFTLDANDAHDEHNAKDAKPIETAVAYPGAARHGGIGGCARRGRRRERRRRARGDPGPSRPVCHARRFRMARGSHPGRLPGLQHGLGGVSRAFLLRPAQRLRYRPRPQIPIRRPAGSLEGLRSHYSGRGEASGPAHSRTFWCRIRGCQKRFHRFPERRQSQRRLRHGVQRRIRLGTSRSLMHVR